MGQGIIHQALACKSAGELDELLRKHKYPGLEKDAIHGINRYAAYCRASGVEDLIKQKRSKKKHNNNQKQGSAAIACITDSHQMRVAIYASAIADELGLLKPEKRAAELGAYHHDCGKLAYRNMAQLNSRKRFTAEERFEIQMHVIAGAYMVNTGSVEDRLVAETIAFHHENPDGTGYVEGLSGEKIPVTARVLAVADRFDTMRSGKPYAPAKTFWEAIADLTANAGMQFDPEIAKLFCEMLTLGDRFNESIYSIACRDVEKRFEPAVLQATASRG